MSAHDQDRDGEGGSGTQDPPFLRLLAHELRNYIAPMHNAMHLLRLKARNDPTLPPVIDMVERQLTAMAGTLEAVSEMDRVRRGEMTLERSAASARALVDRALQGLPTALAARRDRVHVDVPDDLPNVQVDEARLTRALTSVVDNALRYGPSDGDVRVRGRTTGSALEITVDDDGSGMPEQQRERAVEFFALPQQSGHGLGIGLPLAAAIVRLHGGTLALEQRTPGTRVRISIPISGSASLRLGANDSNEDGPVAAPGTAARRRVLLADDSAAVRASLADLLQELGHDVRAAADGAEAVAIAQSWQPEFVLLDIHMPKLNGFEAARKLRSLYPSSVMKLVMMSGDGVDETVRRGARQAGFDHWVDKGLAIGELATILAAPGGAP